MADAIDVHLATPAQTADVEAVRKAMGRLRHLAQYGGVEIDLANMCIGCSQLADKLSQAIGDKP